MFRRVQLDTYNERINKSNNANAELCFTKENIVYMSMLKPRQCLDPFQNRAEVSVFFSPNSFSVIIRCDVVIVLLLMKSAANVASFRMKIRGKKMERKRLQESNIHGSNVSESVQFAARDAPYEGKSVQKQGGRKCIRTFAVHLLFVRSVYNQFEWDTRTGYSSAFPQQRKYRNRLNVSRCNLLVLACIRVHVPLDNLFILLVTLFVVKRSNSN